MRTLMRTFLASAIAMAPMPLAAQDMADVQRQIAELQAEVARLNARLSEISAQTRTLDPVPAAPVPPAPATPAVPAPAAPAETKVTWRGAPEFSLGGGWSFKPRGRLQIDTGLVDVPATVAAGNSGGIATEFRRAYLGVDGTLPGGFGYRVEADFANSSVQLTDVYLTYRPADEITVTLGHHKPFGGLEELTSDLFTPFMERAAFTSAFGFERRVGLSGAYAAGDLLVQVGAFTDNAADLNSDGNNSYSLDARAVFMPEIGAGRLHIGGSAHFRELNDAATTVRYSARPFVHTSDLRLVDTRPLSATGERNFGAELAFIQGPFHATVEGHRMTTQRPGLPDPAFWGGYAEVGMLLTGGDTTGYRGGAYDRIRPVNPLGAGGIGAIQLNARYDRLDLNDAGIVGGLQQTAGLSLVWVPTDYLRFLANYGHLWLSDAALPAGTDGSYQADTVGMRAQIDF